MKSASLKIAAGLEDAISYAQGDKSRGRVAHGVDAKEVRKATGLTQPEFAATYHIPVGTLRDWEQRRSTPDALGRTLLEIIAADPGAVAKLVARAGLWPAWRAAPCETQSQGLEANLLVGGAARRHLPALLILAWVELVVCLGDLRRQPFSSQNPASAKVVTPMEYQLLQRHEAPAEKQNRNNWLAIP